MSTSESGGAAGTGRRRWVRGVAATAVVTTLVVGFLPGSIKSALHAQGRFHEPGHLLVFTVVGFLLNRTSRSGRVRLLLAVTAVALGFATEFGEHLFFGMTVEWGDVGVNVLGATVGAALAECVMRALRAEGLAGR